MSPPATVSPPAIPSQHLPDSPVPVHSENNDPSTRIQADQASINSQTHSSAYQLLAVLAAAHFLVDFFASTIQPLWKPLEKQFHLAEGGSGWAFVLWQAATSVTQLAFGYWSDRFPNRRLIWIGPALGILCLSALGLVKTQTQLAVVLIIGGLGVAAFHPEGAVATASLPLKHRSRVLAVFTFAGFLGQSIGPTYAGSLVTHFKFPSLAWGALGGLPLLALLIPGLQRAARAVHQQKPQTANPPWTRPELLSAIRLLFSCAFRVVPSMGIPLALNYIFESQNADYVGNLQSVFLFGIGIGGLLCALAFRPSLEAPVLWLLPLITAFPLALIPYSSGLVLIACIALTGLLQGISVPIQISHGQKLFPNRPRVASSITLGVGWGTAALIVTATFYPLLHADVPRSAFWIFAACSLPTTLLSLGPSQSPRSVAQTTNPT